MSFSHEETNYIFFFVRTSWNSEKLINRRGPNKELNIFRKMAGLVSSARQYKQSSNLVCAFIKDKL